MKNLLASLGIKQIDLARMSGVSVRQISGLCTGAASLENTTGKNLLALARALGMTMEELMSDQEDGEIQAILTKEAEGLSPEERISIIKVERAKDYSGWRRYPDTCQKLLERIPGEWWGQYSAKHIGEIMRLLEVAYKDGLDRGKEIR